MSPAEEWTDPSDDEFIPGPDFEPILAPQKKSRRGLWLAVGLIVLLGGGAGAAWHFLAGGLLIDPDGETPLVKADAAPIKVRPASPGGLDVPDRDKLVYDRIEGNGERSVVERLLPPPEAPAPMPAPKAPEKAEAVEVPVKPKAEPKPEPVAEAPAPPPPPPPVPGAEKEEPAPSVAEVMNAMSPPPPPPEPKKPEVKQTPVEAPKPAKQVATAVQSSGVKTKGSFKVQLAAVRDQTKIDGEWKRLLRKHTDLLGSLSLDVMRADLGAAKGIYYRMRAGPLGSEDAARALCKKLTERKVGCLVIRPGG